MSNLTLMITRAGQARFTAAQLDADINLGVAQIGLTDVAFVSAPTLEVLPGEFKRLASISGLQVGDSTVHMTIRDESADGYSARGFGLFLADGTLFATYAQADRLFEKSPRAIFLAAIDIAFPTGDVSELRFGNTDFLNPPATEDTAGVARVATDADIVTGTNNSRFITPRRLATRLLGYVTLAMRGVANGVAALAADGKVPPDQLRVYQVNGHLGNVVLSAADVGAVPATRKVTTNGVITGGGDLFGNDIELSVLQATPSELHEGRSAVVVATPGGLADAGFIYVVDSRIRGQNGYRIWSDGFTEQWGYVDGAVVAEVAVAIVFPTPFKVECFGVSGTVRNTAQTINGCHQVQEIDVSLTGANVFLQSDTANTSDAAGGFRWRATGH